MAPADFEALRQSGADCYELVDELPRGPARVAAWNAYAFQTYGDKLVEACSARGLGDDTFAVAVSLFSSSVSWARRASALGDMSSAPSGGEQPDATLPHFHTPIRSDEQLLGMREAAEALRIYVAFDLQTQHGDSSWIPEARARLTEIDKDLETAQLLWVRHPPAEMRGAIGDALMKAIEKAQVLGQLLADPPV